AVSSPFGHARDLVMRKLSLRMSQRRPVPLATAPRRRSVTPPVNSACPQKVLLQPVMASVLATGGDSLYFSDGVAGIVRVAKDGGPPTTITPTVGEVIGPIAIDETNIYFITADDAATGSLYSIPRGGGMPTQLATKLPAPIQLVFDTNSIYWINLGTIVGQDLAADGSIEKIGKDGTGRQLLADKLSAPLELVVDATDVYIAETGLADDNTSAGVRKVSKSGGAVSKITDGETVLSVATSATDIFYSTLTDETASIFRIAKTGGTPQMLIDDVLGFTLIIVDSKLYAAVIDLNGSSPILSIPVLGGALRIVVNAELDTGSFAVDDCAVYYATALRLERAPR
ncbi:MAG TPA: DUF5050 domain-containing protein, partial [Thermoanaerobaculia bacterium]